MSYMHSKGNITPSFPYILMRISFSPNEFLVIIWNDKTVISLSSLPIAISGQS